MLITLWLIGGILLAIGFVAYADSTRRRFVYSIGLVVAASLYVLFALLFRGPANWVVTEAAGILFFGGMALAGLWRSPWWLVCGWALHPLWDFGLHFFGPGAGVAPEWYAVSCLSFDLVVACRMAFRLQRQGGTTPAR
jgi:hypothetical protein